MISSSYWSSCSIQVIPTTIFITVTDAPAARRTIILVGGFSRSMHFRLLSSSYWHRIKLFSALKSTRTRSDISCTTSSFKVMRETSLADAVTHSDCVMGATLVKRPANSLDVAGSVGCSASTDPDHFDYPLRCCIFRNSVGPTIWTLLAAWQLLFPTVRGTALGALHLYP